MRYPSKASDDDESTGCSSCPSESGVSPSSPTRNQQGTMLRGTEQVPMYVKAARLTGEGSPCCDRRLSGESAGTAFGAVASTSCVLCVTTSICDTWELLWAVAAGCCSVCVDLRLCISTILSQLILASHPRFLRGTIWQLTRSRVQFAHGTPTTATLHLTFRKLQFRQAIRALFRVGSLGSGGSSAIGRK